MTEAMKISDEGIAVLREREGCRLAAYQDSVGVWTIGVGHTAAAGDPIPKAGMTITQAEADDLLDEDLDDYEASVNGFVTVPMTQWQFDALVSICFNVGQAAFGGSTFVERLNRGDARGAAEAILWWDQPPEIVPRRQAEYAQFLAGYLPRIRELGP